MADEKDKDKNNTATDNKDKETKTDNKKQDWSPQMDYKKMNIPSTTLQLPVTTFSDESAASMKSRTDAYFASQDAKNQQEKEKNKMSPKILNFNLPSIKSSLTTNDRINAGLDSILDASAKMDFNTYNYFGIFDSFDDYYVPAYEEGGERNEIFEGAGITNPKQTGVNDKKFYRRKVDGKSQVTTGHAAVRSLFNRAGQILIGDVQTKRTEKLKYWTRVRNQASNWRVANNVPLMDSPETRERIRKHSGCTVAELVKASEAGDLGRATYTYADFMYCKHLGRVSNNYLITLRRFPSPPGDCISAAGVGKQRSKGQRGKTDAVGESKAVESQGCLVTWLGTPGNDMSSILSYSVVMPYQEKKSQWEDIQGGDADSQTGILNSIAATFNSSYRRAYCQGYGGNAFNKYVGSLIGGPGGAKSGPYQATDMHAQRDQNKIYGPIDVVKKIYKRGEDGLDFNQSITVTFDYELRSYNGINPRQAMLDLIANILNVTYSSGGWWPGGYRGGGMAQSSVFTNLNIFKDFGGTFSGFCDALQKDYQTLSAKLATSVQSAGGVLQYCLKLLNNIGGMIMGSMLNKMGRPARTFANSLLSEQPTGMWHLMIGNPHHPIMSIGNMVLKNTTIEHYGPLGLDDFPTGLRVKCELDRGKSRDNREIEKLYMNGNDRVYSSIGSKVVYLYQEASKYKEELEKEIAGNTDDVSNASSISKEEVRRIAKNLEDLVNAKAKSKEEGDYKKAADAASEASKKAKENLSEIDKLKYDLLAKNKSIDLAQGVINKAANPFFPWEATKKETYPMTKIGFNMKTQKYEILTKYGDGRNDSVYSSYDSSQFKDMSDIDIAYSVIKQHSEYWGNQYGGGTELGKYFVDLHNDIESKESDESINKLKEEKEKLEKEAKEKEEALKAEQQKLNENYDEKIKAESDKLMEFNDEYVNDLMTKLSGESNDWKEASFWNGEKFVKINSESQIELMTMLADRSWYQLFYKWFGHNNLDSVSMAAQEIEYGSFKKQDIELKTYNPDKTETAESTVMMLKQQFEGANKDSIEVSINHIDGKGVVHHININVDIKKEKNSFLEDYKNYLTTGNIDKLKSYVNTKEEQEKSYVEDVNQKYELAHKAAAIPSKKKQISPPAEDNPGGDGTSVQTAGAAPVQQVNMKDIKNGKWVTLQQLYPGGNVSSIPAVDQLTMSNYIKNVLDPWVDLFHKNWPGSGYRFQISSGYRTYAKQQALYAQYGSPRAAKPGTSKHEGQNGKNAAVDIEFYGPSPYNTNNTEAQMKFTLQVANLAIHGNKDNWSAWKKTGPGSPSTGNYLPFHTLAFEHQGSSQWLHVQYANGSAPKYTKEWPCKGKSKLRKYGL